MKKYLLYKYPGNRNTHHMPDDTDYKVEVVETFTNKKEAEKKAKLYNEEEWSKAFYSHYGMRAEKIEKEMTEKEFIEEARRLHFDWAIDSIDFKVCEDSELVEIKDEEED